MEFVRREIFIFPLFLLFPLFLKVESASAQVISEVYWPGSHLSTADEWIEIVGSGSLEGWRLTSQNSKGEEKEIVLFGYGAAVFEDDPYLVSNFHRDESVLDTEPDIVTSAVSLPNTKLLLRLYSSSGTIVDIVDDGVGAPFAGINASGTGARASMERIDLSLPGNEASNWQTAKVSIGFDEGVNIFGSPGFMPQQIMHNEEEVQSTSSVSHASFASSTSSSPKISSSSSICPNHNPYIEIQGSKKWQGEGSLSLNLIAVPREGSLKYAECFWIYDDGHISEKCNPRAHTLTQVGEYEITLFVNTKCAQYNERMIVEVLPERGKSSSSSSQSFRSSSSLSSFQFQLSSVGTKVATGVLISEIYPSPQSGEDEWIELRNVSDEVIDMTGWMIDDVIDGGSKRQIVTYGVIQPNGFLLLTKQHVRLSLNNGGDEVWLYAPDGSVIDSAAYPKMKKGYAYAVHPDVCVTSIATPGASNICFLPQPPPKKASWAAKSGGASVSSIYSVLQDSGEIGVDTKPQAQWWWVGFALLGIPLGRWLKV